MRWQGASYHNFSPTQTPGLEEAVQDLIVTLVTRVERRTGRKTVSEEIFSMRVGVAPVKTGREGREKFKSAALKNKVANIMEESTGH